MRYMLKKFNNQQLIFTVALILGLIFIGGCLPNNPEEPDSALKTDNKTIINSYASASEFVNDKGYQIMVNSGLNYEIYLPATFEETVNGIETGELFRERNELSKQNGFDFSGYLGKKVMLISFAVENQRVKEVAPELVDLVSEDVNILVDGDKIIGFWLRYGEPTDFTVTRTACVLKEETSAELNKSESINRPAGSPPQFPTGLQGKYKGSTGLNEYHRTNCQYARKIQWSDEIWFKNIEEAQADGYKPCEVCKPQISFR